MPPLPKTIGRYEILEEVGRGSMGIVYKAKDPRIGRTVALKSLAFSFPLGPGEEEEFLKRFYDEARIAGRLSHPNIVTIFDVGEKGAEGETYIAMEFVTGTNLHDLLASGGRLPLTQVADVVDQVARALDYAHENGVVHRDIKPANLVLTTAGQIKILDFGIARLVAGDRTRPGSFFGTPNYMAPEQVTGSDVDGRADQFALGVTLYQLLTGDRPFVGESVTAISYQVVNIDPAPPSKLNPTLSPSFDRIIRKAMAKGAAERYERCLDLAEDLKASVAAWRDGSERSLPQTLVSRPRPGERADGAPGSGEGSHGRAGLSGWLRVLSLGRSPLSLGWIAFLICLALLASAPYLFYRTPASAAAGSPLGMVSIPWSDPIGPGDPPAGTSVVPALPPIGKPAPPRNAKLTLKLQHRFEKGRIYVRIDGEKVLDEALTGTGQKTRWTRELPIAGGRHRIEARVTDRGGSIDDVEGIDSEFKDTDRKELRLTIGFLSKRLKMRFAEPNEAEDP